MAHRITSADLPPDLARFAEAQVAAGRFASVQDVCEAGIEALRRRQERREAKLAALDAALEEGERSGLAEDGVFERVRARLGLPAR
jgi:antitoxin ParD1/3/4